VHGDRRQRHDHGRRRLVGAVIDHHDYDHGPDHDDVHHSGDYDRSRLGNWAGRIRTSRSR
jgi:hypothetical protein